jgi:N-dimethylarginine dimethylaminohydrolase
MFYPWIDHTGSLDPDLATTQWERMVNELTVARAEVRYLETSPYSPAEVFTADRAIVIGANHALVRDNNGSNLYTYP